MTGKQNGRPWELGRGKGEDHNKTPQRLETSQLGANMEGKGRTCTLETLCLGITI